MSDTAPEPQPLDTFAVVEAMGHRTLIGSVTEATVAGKALLRVQCLDGPVQYLPPESLYMLTPCTQAQAREAQRRVYGSLPHYLAVLTAGDDSDGGDVPLTRVWSDGEGSYMDVPAGEELDDDDRETESDRCEYLDNDEEALT